MGDCEKQAKANGIWQTRPRKVFVVGGGSAAFLKPVGPLAQAVEREKKEKKRGGK